MIRFHYYLVGFNFGATSNNDGIKNDRYDAGSKYPPSD